MSLPRRFSAPAVALLASLLVACGTQAVPSNAGPSAGPVEGSAAASIDPVARDAYNAAICPIFVDLLDLDPRLAAMRDAGAQGGDMTVHAAEIDALSAELLLVLDDLEAVPEWTEGANLRYQLITAVHGIRAQLLHVGRDPAARSAADDLAHLPFVASEAMDLAVRDANEAGLSCEAET